MAEDVIAEPNLLSNPAYSDENSRLDSGRLGILPLLVASLCLFFQLCRQEALNDLASGGLSGRATIIPFWGALLSDRRSIDLGGAREKEGHFHYKNFLRASK